MKNLQGNTIKLVSLQVLFEFKSLLGLVNFPS